jgi:hypothetical protein
MHLEIGIVASLGQRLEKVAPVPIIQVNVFLAASTAQDVVDGSSILDSDLARHHGNSAQTSPSLSNGLVIV